MTSILLTLCLVLLPQSLGYLPHSLFSVGVGEVKLPSAYRSAALLYAKKKNKNTDAESALNIASEAILPTSQDTSDWFDVDSTLDELDNTQTIVKLKAEAAAPFRLLRQFIYGAMMGGGGLGTAVTIVPTIKSLQSGGDSTQVLTNLAIDIGAVALGGVLWKKEKDTEKQQFDRYMIKQKKQTNKLSNDEAQEREKLLGLLPVQIQVNERNATETRTLPLIDIMTKGNQNIVIATGSLAFIKDTVIAARVSGSELFTSNNVLVVPFSVEDSSSLTENKGFGAKESILSAPYIANPMQPNVWEKILEREFDLAERQGVKQVRKQGLVLVLNKAGKVVRRGVGLPPWKTLVEDIKK